MSTIEESSDSSRAFDASTEQAIKEAVDVAKAKYKEQALRAVDRARREGFEKASAHFASALQDAEDEARRLEALEKFVNDNCEGADSMNLVQFIMEQVYRDGKLEFKGEQDVLKRLKSVLVRSRNFLSSKLPGLALARKNNGTSHTGIPRAFKLYCTATAPQVKRYIHVEVPYALKKSIVAKGMVYDGREDVVLYGISSYVVDPKRSHNSRMIAFMVERRWSEVRALHASLKKECPWARLPPLPDADHLDASTADSLALLGDPDPTLGGQKTLPLSPSMVTAMRHRRHLALLWLQYVVNDPSFQRNSTLHEFLCGPNHASRVDVVDANKKHMEKAAKRALHILSQRSAAQQSREGSALHGLQKHRYNRDLALYDLQTVFSDAKKIKRAISSVGAASIALNIRLRDKLDDISALGQLFSLYGHKESSGVMLGSDTVAWGYVGNALTMNYTDKGDSDEPDHESSLSPPRALEKMIAHIATLTAHLNFNSSILKDMVISVENSKHVVTDIAVNAVTTQAAVTSQGSSKSPGDVGRDNHGFQAAAEADVSSRPPPPLRSNKAPGELSNHRLEIAVTVAEQYDLMRRLRCVGLLRELQALAQALQDCHKKGQSAWELVHVELEEMELDFDEKMENVIGKHSQGQAETSPINPEVARECDEKLFNKHRRLAESIAHMKKKQREWVEWRTEHGGAKSFTLTGQEGGGGNEEAENMGEVLEHTAGDIGEGPLGEDKEEGRVPARGDSPDSHDSSVSDVPHASPREGREAEGHEGTATNIRDINGKEVCDEKDVTSVTRQPLRVANVMSQVFSSLIPGGETRASKSYLSDSERESEENLFRSRSHDDFDEGGGTFSLKDDEKETEGDHISPKIFSYRRLMRTGSGYAAGAGPSPAATEQNPFAEVDDLFGDTEKDKGGQDKSPLTVEDEVNELLEQEGQEDTPMNRAVARQTINKRRKEEEMERKRRKVQEANKAVEDSALDAHERRLAQRRAGGAGRDTATSAGSSAVRRQNRGAAYSGSTEPLATVNDELFSAPKPVEGRGGAGSYGDRAGQGTASYFSSLEEECTPTPVPPLPQPNTATAPRKQDPASAQTPSTTSHTSARGPSYMAAPDSASLSEPVQSQGSTSHSRDDSDEDLPEGWQRVYDPNGNPYYYHHVSRLSRWEKPSKEVAAQHERRLHESMAREVEAVNQRREERRREDEKAQRETDAKDAMAANVKKRIDEWKRVQPGIGTNLWKPSGQPKTILQLLTTVHDICDFVPKEPATDDDKTSPKQSDVKKAYMKAVRYIHPDKLPPSLPLEKRVLAEAVFVRLTEDYDAWKLKEGL